MKIRSYNQNQIYKENEILSQQNNEDRDDWWYWYALSKIPFNREETGGMCLDVSLAQQLQQFHNIQ